jgi:hypothetical protein
LTRRTASKRRLSWDHRGRTLVRLKTVHRYGLHTASDVHGKKLRALADNFIRAQVHRRERMSRLPPLHIHIHSFSKSHRRKRSNLRI